MVVRLSGAAGTGVRSIFATISAVAAKGRRGRVGGALAKKT
jgi:hypothetical protein